MQVLRYFKVHERTTPFASEDSKPCRLQVSSTHSFHSLGCLTILCTWKCGSVATIVSASASTLAYNGQSASPEITILAMLATFGCYAV